MVCSRSKISLRAWFYERYMSDRHDVAIHLLDIYGNVPKRGTLIALCSENVRFDGRERLEWHVAADLVRGLTDGDTITALYREYHSVGAVLVEIARNRHTPDEVLMELMFLKEVEFARDIRAYSRNTLNRKNHERRIRAAEGTQCI